MLQNIIGIYPAYHGGHHVANIISTDPIYSSRIDSDSYSSVHINAHVNVNNLGRLRKDMIDQLVENIDFYTNQNNVFNAHFGDFCFIKTSGLLDKFPNKKYYLIEFPKDNNELDNLIRRRAFAHHDFTYYDYMYYYGEFRHCHNSDIIKCIVGEEPLSIPVENVYTDDCKILIKTLNDGLNINIDYDTIQPLHEKWWTKVLESVAKLPLPPSETGVIIGSK